jgi:hypothetical protein
MPPAPPQNTPADSPTAVTPRLGRQRSAAQLPGAAHLVTPARGPRPAPPTTPMELEEPIPRTPNPPDPAHSLPARTARRNTRATPPNTTNTRAGHAATRRAGQARRTQSAAVNHPPHTAAIRPRAAAAWAHIRRPPQAARCEFTHPHPHPPTRLAGAGRRATVRFPRPAGCRRDLRRLAHRAPGHRPPRRRGPKPPPPPPPPPPLPPEPLSRPPRAYGGGGGGGGGGGQSISAGLERHAVEQLQVVLGQLRRPVAARRLDKRAPAPRPAPRRRKRQSRPRASNGRLLGAGPRRHGPATTAGLSQAPVRRGRRSRVGDRTRGRWPRGCRTATGRQ